MSEPTSESPDHDEATGDKPGLLDRILGRTPDTDDTDATDDRGADQGDTDGREASEDSESSAGSDTEDTEGTAGDDARRTSDDGDDDTAGSSEESEESAKAVGSMPAAEDVDQEAVEEERSKRLDPENRPENVEIDNTDRDFDSEKGMFTDAEGYDDADSKFDDDAV